jgi:hypothetical protein
MNDTDFCDFIRVHVSSSVPLPPDARETAAAALAPFEQPAEPAAITFLLGAVPRSHGDPAVLTYIFTRFTYQIQMYWDDYPDDFQIFRHSRLFETPEFLTSLLNAIGANRDAVLSLARA